MIVFVALCVTPLVMALVYWYAILRIEQGAPGWGQSAQEKGKDIQR